MRLPDLTPQLHKLGRESELLKKLLTLAASVLIHRATASWARSVRWKLRRSTDDPTMTGPRLAAIRAGSDVRPQEDFRSVGYPKGGRGKRNECRRRWGGLTIYADSRPRRWRPPMNILTICTGPFHLLGVRHPSVRANSTKLPNTVTIGTRARWSVTSNFVSTWPGHLIRPFRDPRRIRLPHLGSPNSRARQSR